MDGELPVMIRVAFPWDGIRWNCRRREKVPRKNSQSNIDKRISNWRLPSSGPHEPASTSCSHRTVIGCIVPLNLLQFLFFSHVNRNAAVNAQTLLDEFKSTLLEAFDVSAWPEDGIIKVSL
jgi:hypothetical protein